jgi:hypothetical protein
MSPRWQVHTVTLLAAALITPPPPGSFALGVLRRDGIIIPFATYDGKRWRTEWPSPREKLEVPIMLRDAPSAWWRPMGPLDVWQAWTGPKPEMVHVRQLDWFHAHCLKQIGLRTDYRPSEPPPPFDTQPYPKDGLVISPPHALDRIEILPVSSPPPVVVDAFNAGEERFVIARRLWHPLTRRQRALVPLKAEAVYAVGDATSARVYYFEVVKEYASRPRDAVGGSPATVGNCASVSYGSGWFIEERGTPLRILHFAVRVLDCDGDRFRHLPFGAMRLSDHLFWIWQSSGSDFEEYNVAEITSNQVTLVVHAPGGGCPPPNEN